MGFVFNWQSKSSFQSALRLVSSRNNLERIKHNSALNFRDFLNWEYYIDQFVKVLDLGNCQLEAEAKTLSSSISDSTLFGAHDSIDYNPVSVLSSDLPLIKCNDPKMPRRYKYTNFKIHHSIKRRFIRFLSMLYLSLKRINLLEGVLTLLWIKCSSNNMKSRVRKYL